MMRERFDRIEIVDLRGDARRGERAGVYADQGVFNIMVGTAITLAIADGSKAEGEASDVYYQDSWREGLFLTRSEARLADRKAETGRPFDPVAVERGQLDDMRPRPFQNGEWVGLSTCFRFRRSGIQTKRDHFVYSPRRTTLLDRLTEFRTLREDAAREMFASTVARPGVLRKHSRFPSILFNG